MISSDSAPSSSSSPQLDTNLVATIPHPTEREVNRFFLYWHRVIQNLLAFYPYSDNYIPSTLDKGLPMCLSLLYTPENRQLNHSELLQKSLQVHHSVTPEEEALVETKTSGQAKSRLWFRMCTGRITASRFKNVCHTDLASPSLSLIMSICLPETTIFKTSATAWEYSQ